MTGADSLTARTVFIVIALPIPWPPHSALPVAGERIGTDEFTAAFDSTGRLVVDLLVEGHRHIHTFQPIDAPPFTRIILTIVWGSAAEVGANVNGVELKLEKDASGSRFLAMGGPAPKAAIGLDRYPVPEHLQPEEELLLETLNDLMGRIASGTRYDLLRASALVRQLLTDSGNLVGSANRLYRLKLSFETVGHADPPLEPKASWSNPDPGGFPGARTEARNLDQFLAFKCLRQGVHAAKVVHVISAAANVKGGVHLGKADSPHDEIVLAWDDAFSIGGGQPSLQALMGIALVTLAGLRPLAVAILAKQR